MKRKPFLTAIALASALFLFSCSNSDKTGLDIPKDAAMVLHINTSSLSSKLSWDEIKASSWFKEMSEKEEDSLTKKIFENPENSGVDLKSDIVVFAKKQGRSGYMVVEGKLKDASAFESMLLKQMHKSDSEIMKDGDLKYMKAGRDQVVSWTGSKFIAISDAPFFSQMNMFGRSRMNGERSSFSIDSLKQFSKDLLALKSSERLGTDERFSDLLKQSGDVHFWMNMDQFMSSMGGMISMFKFGSLLQGNAATYTLNFEDGKISIKSKTYFGKEMAKLMDKFKPKEIDAALINRIPSNNVVGALAVNGDPGFFKEIIQAAGFDGMINGFLGEKDLTLDELLEASKGQLLISVSDLDMKGSNMAKDFNVLVATSVNKKSTFEKLLGIFKEEVQHEDEDSTFNYKLTNDWFAASNNMSTVDRFLAGGTIKQPFTDKITGGSFGLYVDLQKAIKGVHSNMRDASDSAAVDASLKMWQDVIGKSGGYSNGVATGEFEINLVDKSKNSLKQINEYIDKMSAAHKLKKEEVWASPQMDSLPQVMEAPPVAPKEN